MQACSCNMLTMLLVTFILYVTHPPPDVLKQRFMEALLMKNTMAASLAKAEQQCEDWESALCQILSEAEVQMISQSHVC